MRLFLISGLSGSGKSVALKALEDNGYYCVDNLPAEMLPALLDSLRKAGHTQIAVAIDVRSGESVGKLPGLVEHFKEQNVDVHLLFLDAHTETLVKRFSETRRRHPLSDDALTLPECVQQERDLLAEISSIGHRLDTTEISASTLRAWVKDFINLDRGTLTLLFQSFGFKNGLPLDADLVFDVRCLPNPHYDPVLRALSGLDAPVIEFIERQAAALKMFDDIRRFIDEWLPCYLADNRSYLTVAIGCTGGQHRSVYFTEKLAAHFRPTQPQVLVRHRELGIPG